MTVEEFKQLFGPNTRVLVNWDRAIAERWTVTQRVLTDPKDLRGIRLVWTHKGRFGDGGEQIPLLHIGRHLHGQPGRRRVLEISADMCDEKKPVTLVVPAIRRGRGDLVLMDATHRMSALVLAGCEFRVLLCELVPAGDVMWDVAEFG